MESDDARIRRLRDAVAAMRDLRFPVESDAEPDDEIGRLATAVSGLGRWLERRSAEDEKLVDLTRRISSGLRLDEILDHIYDSFDAVIPYDRIGLSLVEKDGRHLRNVWARSRALTIALPVGYRAPIDGSSLAAVLATGRPRILNDLEAYLREHPASESTARIVAEGIRSSLTCPLHGMGRPIGVIFFSSRTPNTYAEVHVDFFLRVAEHVALTVEKGRLYEDLLLTKVELEEVNRELERLSTLDGLTGVANRRHFDDRLLHECRRSARDGTPLSLLLVDVDRFKSYNDFYGHQRGDDCLRAVTAELTGTCRRAGDLVARYGGEEFAVILANTDLPTAAEIARRVRDRVQALGIPSAEGLPEPRVTVSVGVASSQADLERSPDRLVAAADRALYCAKREGRNRVVEATA